MLNENFQISKYPILEFKKKPKAAEMMLELFHAIRPSRLVVNYNWHKMIQKNEKDEVGMTILKFLDSDDCVKFINELTICDFYNFSENSFEFEFSEDPSRMVICHEYSGAVEPIDNKIDTQLRAMSLLELNFKKVSFTSRDMNGETDHVSHWLVNLSINIPERWDIETISWMGNFLLIERPLFVSAGGYTYPKTLKTIDVSQLVKDFDQNKNYSQTFDEEGHLESSEEFISIDFFHLKGCWIDEGKGADYEEWETFNNLSELSVCDFQLVDDYKIQSFTKYQAKNIETLNVYVTDIKNVIQMLVQRQVEPDSRNRKIKGHRKFRPQWWISHHDKFMKVFDFDSEPTKLSVIRFIIFTGFTYSKSSKAKSIKTCIEEMVKRYFKYDVQIEFKFEKANECLHPFLYKKSENDTADKDIFLSCMKNK